MGKVKVYENNAGNITAIVYDGDVVTNVIGDIEQIYSDTDSFLADAVSYFALADPFDPDCWNGSSAVDIAREESDCSDLIAEFSAGFIEIYRENMGIAGQKLFAGLRTLEAVVSGQLSESFLLIDDGKYVGFNHLHDIVGDDFEHLNYAIIHREELTPYHKYDGEECVLSIEFVEHRFSDR